MAEALAALLRANLAFAAAVLLVLALRPTIRRLFGPEVAYGLWSLAPLAALGSLLPSRVLPFEDQLLAGPAWTAGVELIGAAVVAGGHAPWLLIVWGAGAVVALTLLLIAQVRFLRRAAKGRAGPAVTGFIAPRMIVPSDYEARFTSEERRIIRAHERVHIDRHDPRANALIALAQAVNWFNPLVHLAAREARLDQELACDAAVLRRYPTVRRRYAETLLKTQLNAHASPLGCHWSAASRHPLEARIEMLGEPAPSLLRSGLGGVSVAAMGLAVALGAWAIQPARAAQPSFFTFQPPQLWAVEVLGDDAAVQICADATMRAGFARPTPVVGEERCLPLEIPAGQTGAYAFRCRAHGETYGVSATTRGDLARDFTTRVVVARLDGAGTAYQQTRRHRRLGACPRDWIVGDQTSRGGVMIANSVSAQRSLVGS